MRQLPDSRRETLDRVAFTAYFLGAVVPLVALAYVTERYALPVLSQAHAEDPVAAPALIGLVLSVAALSLGSFFVLRRTALRSLRRMDRDNARLGALLGASTSLAGAQDGHDAAALAATSALELTGADVAFVLMRDGGAGPGSAGEPVLLESAGEQAAELYASQGKALTELANLVLREGRPALLGSEWREGGPLEEPDKALAGAAVVPIPGEPAALGALAVAHTRVPRDIEPAQIDSLATLGALVSVALRNADLRDAQRNFFAHVTEILVAALDAHLPYHRGHGKRVAQLANLMGRELGLDEETMQRLHFAAQLHDIGMLKLDRPEKLNPKTGEKHALLGARMLGGIRLWREVAPVVKHHHERWDGTGYPDRLAGEAIPLESRIIAICDAFDSMTSSSSYKVAAPVEEGVREIELSAGTQFDRELVRVFHRLVERGVIAAEA